MPAYLLMGLPSGLPATESGHAWRSFRSAFIFVQATVEIMLAGFLSRNSILARRNSRPDLSRGLLFSNKYFVVGLISPDGSAFEEMTLAGGPQNVED